MQLPCTGAASMRLVSLAHSCRSLDRASRSADAGESKSAALAMARLRGGTRLVGGRTRRGGARTPSRRHTHSRARRATSARCLPRPRHRRTHARRGARGGLSRVAGWSAARRLRAREERGSVGCDRTRRRRGSPPERRLGLPALPRPGAHRPPVWRHLASTGPLGYPRRGIERRATPLSQAGDKSPVRPQKCEDPASSARRALAANTEKVRKKLLRKDQEREAEARKRPRGRASAVSKATLSWSPESPALKAVSVPDRFPYTRSIISTICNPG